MAIVDYISEDNPDAAMELLHDIEERVEHLTYHPQTGRIGRVTGTRELVVKPNYIAVYVAGPNVIEVLRVLHAARQWP